MESEGNLVLRRNEGEQVVIDHAGERLVLTMLHGWRLGFNAPLSFSINRAELQAEIDDAVERQANLGDYDRDNVRGEVP